jgi:hypothetical protein
MKSLQIAILTPKGDLKYLSPGQVGSDEYNRLVNDHKRHALHGEPLVESYRTSDGTEFTVNFQHVQMITQMGD